MKVNEILKLMPSWTYVEISDMYGDTIIPDYMEYLKDSGGSGALDSETIVKVEAIHFTHAMKAGVKIYINTAIPF